MAPIVDVSTEEVWELGDPAAFEQQRRTPALIAAVYTWVSNGRPIVPLPVGAAPTAAPPLRTV